MYELETYLSRDVFKMYSWIVGRLLLYYSVVVLTLLNICIAIRFLTNNSYKKVLLLTSKQKCNHAMDVNHLRHNKFTNKIISLYK